MKKTLALATIISGFAANAALAVPVQVPEISAMEGAAAVAAVAAIVALVWERRRSA